MGGAHLSGAIMQPRPMKVECAMTQRSWMRQSGSMTTGPMVNTPSEKREVWNRAKDVTMQRSPMAMRSKPTSASEQKTGRTW